MSRRHMQQIGRGIARNLKTNWGVEGPFQWGTIASVTPGNGTTLGVCGVYLDNSSTGTGAVITSGIPYVSAYAPKVGDIVVLARMAGPARTQRIILSSLAVRDGGFAKNGVISNPYRARAHKSATQSITTTEAKIQFDAEDWDPNNNYDITTNKGRYTCPLDGYYRVSGAYRVTTQSEMVLDIFKNGSGYARLALSGTAGAFVAAGCTTVKCVATDYLELWAVQPGGAQNIPTGTPFNENYMEVEYTGTDGT